VSVPNVIVSPTGVQGPRGNAVLNGARTPLSSDGIDGDYWINTTSYPTSAVLYGPKASGTWPGSGITFGGGVTGALLAANNLSDVQSAATSRNSLGLGSAATQASSAFDASGAAAAAQAAAIADAVTKYLALAGGGTVTGNVTIADGNVVVDSTGTAINAVDRGATTNYAAYAFRTAGIDRFAWQMEPGSQDLYLVDSANGLPVLRVQPGASGPNLSLLDGGTDFGSGVGVVHVPNAATVPSSNPASGAVVYAEGGVLKARSASGAIGSVLPVGTTAGTVAAGNDSRFTSTPWIFDVTKYGAVGDSKVVADGAMSTGSAILTSASGQFESGIVGKTVIVNGAGALGVTSLVAVAQSRQSSTQITLSLANASGGNVTGAKVVWGTSDSTAFQTATDAAEAYLAAGHSYAEVFYPPLPYMHAGALNTSKSGNGQTAFGVYATSAGKKELAFVGVGDGAAAVRHWLQGMPQLTGSCIISAGVYASTGAQITDINAHGNPAVISGPNEASGYGVNANFSNLMVVVKNLAILTTHSAYGLTYGALNLWGCANAHVENVGYGTLGTVASPSTDYSSPGVFGTGLSVGLLLPAPGNNDYVVANNVSCGGGYTYAMFLTEHAVTDRYMALYCWAGLCAVGTYAGSVGSVHAMNVISASIEACTHELYIVGPGSQGVGPTIYIGISTESSTPNVAGNSAGAMNAALGRVVLTGLFTESGVSVSNPTGIELVNGQVPRAIKRKTTTFTGSPIDRTLVCDTTSAGFTGTLPAADYNPVEYVFKNVGANTLTVGTTSSQLIYTTSGTGATTATVATGVTLRVQALYNGTAWGWYAV
jgi:hypothetical protein